jgi:hypothetical protein
MIGAPASMLYIPSNSPILNAYKPLMSNHHYWLTMQTIATHMVRPIAYSNSLYAFQYQTESGDRYKASLFRRTGRSLLMPDCANTMVQCLEYRRMTVKNHFLYVAEEAFYRSATCRRSNKELQSKPRQQQFRARSLKCFHPIGRD